MPPSPLRSRLLDILDGLISAPESPLSNISAMQTVMARLALLASQYYTNNETPVVHDESDTHALKGIINKIMTGGCGQLELGELEHHYNAGASNTDSENDLRSAICVEAIVRCLDFGSLVQKRKVLHAIDVRPHFISFYRCTNILSNRNIGYLTMIRRHLLLSRSKSIRAKSTPF